VRDRDRANRFTTRMSKSPSMEDHKLASMEEAVFATLVEDEGLGFKATYSLREKNKGHGNRRKSFFFRSQSVQNGFCVEKEAGKFKKVMCSGATPPSPRRPSTMGPSVVFSPVDKDAERITTLPEEAANEACTEASSEVAAQRAKNSGMLLNPTPRGGPERGSVISTSSLRDTRDTQLTQSVVQQETSSSTLGMSLYSRFPLVASWLCLWGILPQGCLAHEVQNGYLDFLAFHWNQIIMLVIAVAILSHRVLELFTMRMQIFRLCDLLLALDSAACLILMRSLRCCQRFVQEEVVLLHYADSRGFSASWGSQSRRHLLLIIVCWISAVSSRLLFGGVGSWPGVFAHAADFGWLHAAEFVFVTGIFTGVNFTLLHHMNALVTATDTYSYNLLSTDDLCVQEGAQEWNILQAMLRRVSGANAGCFLASATASMLMLLLCVVGMLLDGAGGDRGSIIATLVPVLILSGVMGKVLMHAAEVTGRCRRVPPFINSIDTSEEHRCQVQFLVQYIENSAAGYYIREVKITAELALKVIYIGVMAIFTMFTKAATGV